MLQLPRPLWAAMVAHAYDGFPDEACGLLGGDAAGTVGLFVPCVNADASSLTFSLGPDQLDAERAIEDAGLEVIGVMHSHTHTDAYPSPTDVDKGSNPLLAGWHWVLVSLRHPEPVVRSFTIADGVITEEPVELLAQ